MGPAFHASRLHGEKQLAPLAQVQDELAVVQRDAEVHDGAEGAEDAAAHLAVELRASDFSDIAVNDSEDRAALREIFENPEDMDEAANASCDMDVCPGSVYSEDEIAGPDMYYRMGG